MKMKKAIIVGASGVLGKLICTELLNIFNSQISLTVTDYKLDRGHKLADSFKNDVQFQYLNINDEKNIVEIIKDVDIVITALNQKEAYVQKACVENNILCIDVSPFYDFVEKITEISKDAQDDHTASICMAGFFPGLSGLMVKEAIWGFQEITEINIGLLQNKNALAGISGILDMLKIIDHPVIFDNQEIEGFSRKRKMYFSNSLREQEVRLINHSEKKLLTERLINCQINYWTAWNSNVFNKLIFILKKMGFLKIIHRINKKVLSKIVKHDPTRDEKAWLSVEVIGKINNDKRTKLLSLSTFSDYHTTAIVTASLAKIALQKEIKGVVYPFEITSLNTLLSLRSHPDITWETRLDPML